MAYDEGLAERLRDRYDAEPEVEEKSMFGGLAFMVNGHMSCGVVGETLMVRVGPARYDEALAHPHARVMDFTGRPMRGFVFVDPDGVAEDGDLEHWVRTSLEFVRTLPTEHE